MSAKDGIVLNYYGPCEFGVKTPSGGTVSIVQKTKYPTNGRIGVSVIPEKSEPFALHVRIPLWSRTTKVSLNGNALSGVTPGKYLVIDRKWDRDDKIEIELDMSPRLWVGEKECDSKVSIFTGPLLLAYDPRFDVHDLTALPRVDVTSAAKTVTDNSLAPQPMALLRFKTCDGKSITLCDFASAGIGGNSYVSWLPASGLEAVPFTRDNPMRIKWPVESKPTGR